MTEPWMPSDEAMVIESVRVYRMFCDRGDSVAVAENESCRAVARLAVESYQRWCAEQSGVDVEAIVDPLVRRFCQQDRNGGGCPLASETGCSACAMWSEDVAGAIRTAIAQATSLRLPAPQPLKPSDG